jgi:HD-GYP domain-containing protein (c-di-GMP phosphodiesterase class II)
MNAIKKENLTDLLLRDTIRVISKIGGIRDPYTKEHQFRVCELACMISEELGLPADLIDGICIASVLHDIGKIYVPTEILTKPGKLSDQEFALVKAHSEYGYNILKDIRFPWPIADWVLQHHEKMDGFGYPNKLKGNEISLEASIITVADVVEAMCSHRPYRAALGVELALIEIKNNRGDKYRDEVVDACLDVFQKDFEFDEPNKIIRERCINFGSLN